jgi:F420-non-reducing hydrogenase large subunit
MSFRAKIEPITRVEGHGAVDIEIEDKKVKSVRMNIVESPRFFEALLVGVRGEEAPRIAERICGICYIAHGLVSVKAVESAWGTEPPRRAERLRRALHLGGVLSSHLLHLAYLATPDYLPSEGRFPQLGASKPQLFRALIDLYNYSNNLTETIGGRRVHVSAIVPGGMSKSLSREQAEKLQGETATMVDKASAAVGELLEAFEGSYGTFPLTPAFGMALTDQGRHELYEGEVAVLDQNGERMYGFTAGQYMENIAERSIEHSYVKYPYLKREGFPQGIYRTGCLPRLGATRGLEGERADELYRKYRGHFKPGRSLVAYNSARAIEALSILEQLHEILGDDIYGDARAEAKPRKGVGVGLMEAPRGILIHHYESDGNGSLTKANIITPTTQNAPAMEGSIRAFVEGRIDEFTGAEGGDKAVGEVEQLIRCYDPCISCSVHMAAVGSGR